MVGNDNCVRGLFNRTGKLAQRFFRFLPLELRGMQIQREADGAQQIRSIELGFLHAIRCPCLNDFGDRLLVRLLRQHYKRYGASCF